MLHGDSPGLIHICSTGDWTGRVFSDLDAATKHVTYLDGEGREGIYCRVTTLKNHLPPGKRGGATDTLALPALWADLDLAGPGHAEANLPPDEAAGRKVIATSGLPEPTLWIHSGGGLYPIWLLDKPHAVGDDLDDVKDLTAGWQKVIEHAARALGWKYGAGVGDLARVLRIPGTINRKEGLARPCRIVSAAPKRYTVTDLYQALANGLAAAPYATTDAPSGTQTRTTDGTAPGDDYSARTDWADILEPHGWTLSHYQDQTRYWTRPGKNTGLSASTNHLGTDRLHVFTTSTVFDANTSYHKFAAYTILNHGGDYSGAAKALADAGYGTPRPNPSDEQRQAFQDLLGEDVDLDAATATAQAKRAADPMKYFNLDGGRRELLVATLARDITGEGPLAEGTDNLTWSYRDGVWYADKHAVRNRATRLLGELYRDSHARNAESVVRAQAPRITCDPVNEVINFRNGLYHWQPDQLHPHDPKVLSTVQLSVDWDPGAACPEFDAFLAQVVPADMVDLVWELIGYLMFSGNPLHKAVMFTGAGRNGKGTLLRVIVSLLGQRNVTSASLHDLVNTRFTTASLFGKIANIAGDIDGTYLDSTAIFKAITGQDLISAEHKGRDRFDFTPWAVPVFSANKIPGSADVTTGYLSRWLVVPFPHNFTGREDRGLTDRLTTKVELAGIAAKAMPALRRLM
ncbi:MAG: DNA primase family protein, partial [Stackebrandtia sp.]